MHMVLQQWTVKLAFKVTHRAYRKDLSMMSAIVALTESDERYLAGEHGAGAALAMRVVLAVARSIGATRLVDVESAHVDGCLYIGPVSIDFVRTLVDGGATVKVPTSLNVGSIDQRHPE